MAESSSARHGESSQARTPPHNPKIKLMQQLPRTSSRKDLQFPGAEDISENFQGNVTQTLLPKWFDRLFPLLVSNETFIALCLMLAAFLDALKAAFLLDIFLKWISFMKLACRPSFVIMKWWWWFYSSLFIKPGLYVALSIASILGITEAIGVLLVTIIHAIDYYGDKLMTTIGVLINFVKEQWHQTNHDVLEAFNKLKKWAKETLEAVVRAVKYATIYMEKLLKKILPISVYDWIVQWIDIVGFVVSHLYLFSKYLLATFDNILDTIARAWFGVVRLSQSPTPSKAVSIESKQKDQPKPSVGPSKPVEAATSQPQAPAEDSTKQRKA